MPIDDTLLRQQDHPPRRVPFVWELAALAVVLATLAGFFASGSHRVFTERDDGYVAASEHRSLEGILSDRRTFAYPTLLRLVAAVSPGYVLLPYVQAAIFIMAALFLAYALRRVGWPPWVVLLTAAPLGASELLTPFSRRILTECVAGACGVLVFAVLLLALVEGKRRWWVGLGVLLFLSYQLRPTYIVLVPLVPALAMLFVARRLGGGAQSWWRLGLRASALSFIPFLAFCALRWLVVGHFGLVSFGGYNVIGVASSMLSPKVVASMPQSLRPLAQAMLEERTARGLGPIDERRFGSEKARYRAWYAEYNPNILEATRQVVFPATLERYRERRQALLEERSELERERSGGETTARLTEIDRQLEELGTRQHYSRRETNRLFSELARAIVRARARLYADWIAHGTTQGLTWTLERVRGVAWTAYAALAALVAVLVAAVFFPSLRRAGLGAHLARGLRRIELLLWAAGAVYVSMLFLVVLVEPPIERYLMSAALLLPSALGALAAEMTLALARAVSETRAPRAQW